MGLRSQKLFLVTWLDHVVVPPGMYAQAAYAEEP
jgi:hypothetical protein